MHLVNGTGNSPSPGQPTPGVVKQDKSSRGSVDTTKTRSGPQRVRMSSGEGPIGAAKGKQSDTEALWQPPPPPPRTNSGIAPLGHPPGPVTEQPSQTVTSAHKPPPSQYPVTCSGGGGTGTGPAGLGEGREGGAMEQHGQRKALRAGTARDNAPTTSAHKQSYGRPAQNCNR